MLADRLHATRELSVVEVDIDMWFCGAFHKSRRTGRLTRALAIVTEIVELGFERWRPFPATDRCDRRPFERFHLQAKRKTVESSSRSLSGGGSVS